MIRTRGAVALAGSISLVLAVLLGFGAARPFPDPAPRGGGEEGVAQGAADPRFGVVITGPSSTAEPSAIRSALAALGVAAWYRYDGRPDAIPGRVELVRPGASAGQVAERARSEPGLAWLVGNEPNVPGQDDLDPAAYADFLWQMASTIRGADPTALLVGPNLLNWETTCAACPGFPRARTWAEELLETYGARYGPLPLDAWAVHTYNLQWHQLPLVNPASDLAELSAVRAWLDARGLDLPIWLTEFGVIWGFEGIEWLERPEGGFFAEARGSYRADLLAVYLDEMLGWLSAFGESLRVDRWFLYATTPPPEPFATTASGLALLDAESLSLTEFGEQYRGWATRAMSDE